MKREIMIRPRQFILAIALLALCSVSAWADVNVSYPVNGAVVAPQFSVYATSDSCSGQPVAAMGFSLDNSSDNTFSYNSSIYSAVNAPLGAHVLHVKSWGIWGSGCDTDVAINVTDSNASASGGNAAVYSGGSGPYVPWNAAYVSSIQTLGDWVHFHDTGTYGSSDGSSWMSGSPSVSGNARGFYTTYNYYGGERYYASFGDDIWSKNFLYDGWIYLGDGSNSVSNLEMDMNQVMPNGQTVIFGIQCDGWTGTWDYSANGGSPWAPWDHWVVSSAPCNLQSWAKYTWHHVQLSYSRDDWGNVTYNSVWVDGYQQAINATVPSAYALGWAPTLLTNFQIGSYYSGWSSSVVYLDNLTVARW